MFCLTKGSKHKESAASNVKIDNNHWSEVMRQKNIKYWSRSFEAIREKQDKKTGNIDIEVNIGRI